MILDKFDHQLRNHKYGGGTIARKPELQEAHTYYLASEVNIFLEQLKPYIELAELRIENIEIDNKQDVIADHKYFWIKEREIYDKIKSLEKK